LVRAFIKAERQHWKTSTKCGH